MKENLVSVDVTALFEMCICVKIDKNLDNFTS